VYLVLFIGRKKPIISQAGQGSSFQSALTALAATGLEVAITELDIAGAPTSDYTAVVNACLNTAACVGITSWGVRDAVRSITRIALYVLSDFLLYYRTLGAQALRHFSSITTTNLRLLTTLSFQFCEFGLILRMQRLPPSCG